MSERQPANPITRQARGTRMQVRLGILGAIVCALLILALIAVHTPPVRRYVLDEVVALLAREQIEFSTDELGYNVLNASVNLRNVRVRTTTWPDAPTFATIGRIDIDMSLLQLLRGRFVVQSGEIENVDIDYVVDEQGRDNLPVPPSDPNESQSSADYLISSLSIHQAQVQYENRAQEVDVRLPFSSIDVRGSEVTDRHHVTFDAADGHVRVEDREAAIDRASGEVDLGHDDVAIERIEVESLGSRAAVTGTIANFEAAVADIAVQSSVDVARVAPLTQVDGPLAGHITIDAAVTGPVSAPAIDAHVSGTAIQFRDLRDMQLNADAAYDVAANRADVSSLEVRGPWGEIAGAGTIATDRAERSQVNAEIDNVDVGTVMRGLGLSYVAATRVNGMLQAEWPGLEYLQANGEAQATLRPTASQIARSAMPVGGRVVATGNGRRIDAQLTRVEVPGGEVSGTIAVTSDRRLDGTITGMSADIGRLTSSIEALTGRPQGSLLPTPVNGAVELHARLGGTVGEPSAMTTINAPALDVGTVDGIAVNAEAAYTARALTITQADVSWQESHAHVDGRVGLGPDQPIALTLMAGNVDIEALLKAMNRPDVPVSGTFTLRGTVSGTTTTPAAALDAQASNLVAYQERIGSLDADVRLDGRQLTLSQLVVDKPQPDASGRLVAKGTYHLDRKTYTFDLQSQNLRLVSLTLPGGHDVRGNVETLTARGAGSLDSPEGSVELDVDALETDATPLGRVTLNAVAKDMEATITASSDRFNLDANALVGLMRPWPVTVTLSADNLDLAALPLGSTPESSQPTRSGLQGQLRATIDASATLTEPAQGTAMIALDSLDGTWNGRPFTVTSSGPIQYANERLAVEKVEVMAGDTTLDVTGDLPLADEAGTGAIDVNLQGNLATLVQYLPAETNLAADGTVEITGSLRGTLEHIDPDLMLTVDKGLVFSPALEPGFSNIVLRARVEHGAAHIDELSGHWGTASLEASGSLPLDALPDLPVEFPRTSEPATFKAAVTGLDPASIPGTPPQLSGRISAEAQVMSPRADLSALDGSITFQDLDVSFSGVDLAQRQPSAIALASGSARIEQLDLSGSAGDIHAAGSVGLIGERELNLDVDGSLNVAAASLLTDQIRAEGHSRLALVARGTMSEPEVTGTIDLTNVRAVSDEPDVAADNVYAHFDLEGRRVVLTRLDADVNGGTLTGSGEIELGNGTLSDVNIELAAKDFAYDAPLDLRSISDSDITITKKGDEILVSGTVTIDEAGLTGDINFDTGLLATITARPSLDLTEQRNPILERVRFNVDVNTATPILVDNNLARAEIETDLTVVGTPYDTGLLGEMTLLEGSEIRLNERNYETERGVLTFSDERRIAPSFDLRLSTTAGNYDVTVAVRGTPGDTESTLTSDPSLPEPDIMALLVTGRTLDEMRGEEYEVARAQVLSYLAGRAGSGLGRGLQRATGLSEVRIEPTLIANEADPSARLTIGQDLTDDLKLIYSTNLTDSNDQIWVAEYDITRRFQTRGVRQEDSSYRFDFRHDVRFGGRPEPRRTPRTQPAVVDAPAEADEAAVRKTFGIEAGDAYDFFAIRYGVEQVEQALIEQGYLQSRVGLERGVEADEAHLTLHVTRGPRVTLEFVGATPPTKVREEVRTQWHRGVFDKQRADDGADALREWLMKDNHLQAKVEYEIQDAANGEREVVFNIEPGPRSETVVLAFEGASGIDPDQLDTIVAQQGLERQLFTDPIVVTELLERYYREQGFLVADIDEPRYEYQDATARVVLTVREGPKFTVGQLTLSGNTIYPTDLVISQLPLVEGEPYLPLAADNSLEKIRELYWAKGYNDVRPDYTLERNGTTGQVNVAFTIDEGRQSVIAGISIEGNDRVSDRLVREQIRLTDAQPLDLSALARSRRNLYDTGAFSVVDITRQDAPESAHADGSETARERPVAVNVQVREVQPIQIRYGASYDTERGVGGIFDISNHNSLGGARQIGLRSRYDRQLHEGRLYLNQPALNYLPKTTAAIYVREEFNPPTELTDPFDTSRKGVSIQQELALRDLYVLTYGYRLERVHSLTPIPGGGVLAEAYSVSPVTSTLTRETRDEILDASRGAFLSQAFSYAPGWLGSDQPHVKYFGQYFHYFPLRPPTRKPFTNDVIRPRLVYATGVRLGLAHGIGGDVPRSERFFAGGSATMRGFAQNAVGSIGPNRIPVGGEAMLVLNNEIRMPLVSIFDGVAFVDIGNVFDHISDLSLTDLRASTGIGLRVRTPWVLLRGDYGIVISPRPGEPRSRFYFSIGQAF